MNILILRTSPTIANGDMYNLQGVGQAKALVRLGHTCDVMYYNGQNQDTVETIFFDENLSLKIIRIKGFGCFHEGFFPTLKRYIDDYDIIQVTEYLSFTSCYLNMFYNKKIINYQGPYFFLDNKRYELRMKVLELLLGNFTNKCKLKVITKSKLAEDYMIKKGISNVTTIGVGLDIENLIQKDIKNDFINELILSSETNKHILYVGRIEPRRNIEFLITVFGLVCKKNNNCKLILIGTGKDEYVEKCKLLAKELGVYDNILWCNKISQNELGYIYSNSNIFVFPTNYDIFGMVLLESMYFKLPIITTLNGGSSTLISDGYNGLILEELNEVDWSNRITDLLENDDLSNMISLNGYNTIINKFTWDKLAPLFEKEYISKLK